MRSHGSPGIRFVTNLAYVDWEEDLEILFLPLTIETISHIFRSHSKLPSNYTFLR